MLVASFYSFVRGIAVEDMWHDNDECQIGQSIAPADRLAGRDHILKHCWLCVNFKPGATQTALARAARDHEKSQGYGRRSLHTW